MTPAAAAAQFRQTAEDRRSQVLEAATREFAELGYQGMGQTYPELIGDRFSLLCQLQSYAVAGDPEIGVHVARGFQRLFERGREPQRSPARAVAEFFAYGMLANITTILGLAQLCEPLWEGKHQPLT